MTCPLPPFLPEEWPGWLLEGKMERMTNSIWSDRPGRTPYLVTYKLCAIRQILLSKTQFLNCRMGPINGTTSLWLRGIPKCPGLLGNKLREHGDRWPLPPQKPSSDPCFDGRWTPAGFSFLHTHSSHSPPQRSLKLAWDDQGGSG